MKKVRITVIRKMNTKDVYGTNPPCQIAEDFESECHLINVGDEFVTGGGTCPAGLCGRAFTDIQRDISHLWLGGNYPRIKDAGVMISCCTDGLIPVFFKLERPE